MARNSLSNFNRELPKEPSCEIISKSVNRFSRRSRLKLFSIYSPGPFCSTEWNHSSNFSRGLANEPFCEIISKSVSRISRRKLISIYSPGGHFVQHSGMV